MSVLVGTPGGTRPRGLATPPSPSAIAMMGVARHTHTIGSPSPTSHSRTIAYRRPPIDRQASRPVLVVLVQLDHRTRVDSPTPPEARITTRCICPGYAGTPVQPGGAGSAERLRALRRINDEADPHR